MTKMYVREVLPLISDRRRLCQHLKDDRVYFRDLKETVMCGGPIDQWEVRLVMEQLHSALDDDDLGVSDRVAINDAVTKITSYFYLFENKEPW